MAWLPTYCSNREGFSIGVDIFQLDDFLTQIRFSNDMYEVIGVIVTSKILVATWAR